MNERRIVFMGTPPFAVGTLDALMEAGYQVAAVVTAPDRPAGRGRQPRPSAVKERALELGLPLLQPERLKDPDFHVALDALDASLYIVVAFRMLPEAVWARARLGAVNLHASLLPDYRGAAPIHWAVINGEQRTGLTTFLIQHEIDTGDILLQEELLIGDNETTGELHDRMMSTGAALMVRTVQGLFDGTLTGHPQNAQGPLHSAPKIGPGTCRMDLGRTAREVHDLVRGMSPVPGAWCMWQEEGKAPMHFKVLRTLRTAAPVDVEPGTVHIRDGHLLFACRDQWLEALEVQPEGKRRMKAEDLVRGIRGSSSINLR